MRIAPSVVGLLIDGLLEATAVSPEVAPGVYLYQGQKGVWRTLGNGDRAFFPEGGGAPLAADRTLQAGTSVPERAGKEHGGTGYPVALEALDVGGEHAEVLARYRKQTAGRTPVAVGNLYDVEDAVRGLDYRIEREEQRAADLDNEVLNLPLDASPEEEAAASQRVDGVRKDIQRMRTERRRLMNEARSFRGMDIASIGDPDLDDWASMQTWSDDTLRMREGGALAAAEGGVKNWRRWMSFAYQARQELVRRHEDWTVGTGRAGGLDPQALEDVRQEALRRGEWNKHRGEDADDKFMKRNVLSGLKEEERALVRLYTDDGFELINAGLRGSKLSDYDRSRVSYQADVLRQVISKPKNRIKEDVVVYRGLHEGHPLAKAIAAHKLEPGTVFKDDGFVSTSLYEHIASGFAGRKRAMPVLRLGLKKGSEAVYLGSSADKPGASSNVDEHEVLVQAGKSIRVLSIEKKGVRLLVHAELMD